MRFVFDSQAEGGMGYFALGMAERVNMLNPFKGCKDLVDLDLVDLHVWRVTWLPLDFRERLCSLASNYHQLHDWLQDYESNNSKVMFYAEGKFAETMRYALGRRTVATWTSLVGYVYGKWKSDTEMGNVDVRVNATGWGIGSALLRTFEEYCRDCGCQKIPYSGSPYILPPERFLLRNGYQRIPGTCDWFKDFGR